MSFFVIFLTMRLPKILVVEVTQGRHGWSILQGVHRFSALNTKHGWSIRITQETGDLEAQIQQWEPDGAIVHPNLQLNLFRRYSVPLVQIFAKQRYPDIAQIFIDEKAIAEQAARHFLDRGIKRVLYASSSYAPSRSDYYRFKHMKEYLESNGGDCVLLLNDGDDYHVQTATFEVGPRLLAKLRSVERPFGVFAFDFLAYSLYDPIRIVGLDIPRDVYVLGVNDDPSYCLSCLPNLSSIALPFLEVGYRSSEMLQCMFEGVSPSELSTRLYPSGVVSRGSTALMNIDDEFVERVVRHIQENIREPINVESIMKHFGVSRTKLKTRFREALNRSALEEIHRQKIEIVKTMLRESTASVIDVAIGTGFSGAEHLIRLFKRKTGLSPSEYRRLHARRE